jgi:hypothetical protein
MRGDGEPHAISETVSWDFALPHIEHGLPAPLNRANDRDGKSSENAG